MNTEEYLNKLHADILLILDEIVKICKRHNLKYYLIGGTLLGAIRHKGFIPWDDDLDIVMPREDYVKFTDKYYSELPSDYQLDWFNTNPKYNHVFAKVFNVNTLFEEIISNNVHSKRGIFVDIFPMDVSKGYSSGVCIRKKIVNQVNRLLCLKPAQNEQQGLTRACLCFLSARKLHKIALHFMKDKSNGAGLYYSNFGSQYNIKRQTLPIAYFGDGIIMQFEDREYNCPVNYNKILTSIYGLNYMDIPPKSKRRTHYPFRVVFSDGQEVFFGIPKKRIMAEKN